MSYRIAVSLALSLAATLTATSTGPPSPAYADDGTIYIIVPVPFISPFCIEQETADTLGLVAGVLPPPLGETVGGVERVGVCFVKPQLPY